MAFFKGQGADEETFVPSELLGNIKLGNLNSPVNAAQYDNPRGYVGLGGLQVNKPKGTRIYEHDIEHEAEGGKLSRTGPPTHHQHKHPKASPSSSLISPSIEDSKDEAY